MTLWPSGGFARGRGLRGAPIDPIYHPTDNLIQPRREFP
jgi:hypothetical protein